MRDKFSYQLKPTKLFFFKNLFGVFGKANSGKQISSINRTK